MFTNCLATTADFVCTGRNLFLIQDTYNDNFIWFYLVVTVYATLGDAALIHAINETEVALVVVDENMLRKFVTLSPKMPTVKTLVYFGKTIDLSFLDSAKNDLVIKSLQDTEEIGLKPENSAYLYIVLFT